MTYSKSWAAIGRCIANNLHGFTPSGNRGTLSCPACYMSIKGEDAATMAWWWWCPACAPLCQHTLHLLLGEALALYTDQRQSPLWHMNLDQVILFDQRNGTTL